LKTLECIVFDVEHGFSSFVKSPNGYGLLIDFGSRGFFSPVKWIRGNYNLQKGNIEPFEGRRIAEAFVSHLHMDHFDDVGSLKNLDKPKHLYRDKKVVPMLEKRINAEKDERNRTILTNFKNFQAEYTKDPECEVDWGFDSFHYFQLPYDAAQEVSSDDNKLINNRSYVVAVQFGQKKILFPGDIEVEGWIKAFEYPRFASTVKGTSFFVASHHGHKSGFTSEILKYTGKPDVYIVSTRSGDEAVDTSYSKAELSNGCLVEGERYRSRIISTREKQSSIKISIDESGNHSISWVNTPDNLDDHQRKILNRQTKRVLKAWRLR
jgi:beta-lactamase superfamily II metal-dependent hydrolase